MRFALCLLLAAALLAGCSPASGKKVQRGEWDGNLYQNTFAGFNFRMPEGWLASSDEEIARMMEQSVEMLEDDGAYQKAVESMETVYDAMMADPNIGNNVIVMYQNVGLMGMLGAELDEYVEETVKQLEESDQFAYTFVETTDQKLGDKDYRCAQMSVDISGITATQYYLMAKESGYVVAVIFSVFDGTPLSDMLALFEPAQ